MSQVVQQLSLTKQFRFAATALMILNATACFWTGYSFMQLTFGHPASIVIAMIFGAVIAVDGVWVWAINK